jgi:hypothetical protein
MKRTFAKQIQHSLMALCMVLGAFLVSATSAAAQSGVSDLGADLNWKSSDDAQQVLVAAIQQLHNDPQVTTVGSPSYTQAHYFKEIYRGISDGSSTWKASRDALAVFSDSTNGGSATQPNTTDVVLSDPQKEALFQVAVGLLTD